MSTDKPVENFPPMTPQERAAALGVSLTQRLKLNLRDHVPNRFISFEEATFYDDSWYWDGTIGACRYGHQAPRNRSNKNQCSDCLRVKDGLEPIYGASRTRKYYDKPRRAAKDPSAPVVIQAPTAAPAQVEPTAKEQELLAAIAEHRDLDKACAAVGWLRSKLDARVSVNAVLAKAVNDLCDRLLIPRTLKAPSEFPWTPAIERDLVRHFVDSGLLASALEAVGVTPSQYFEHLESTPSFFAAIENARPLALTTLTERSLYAASTGNDRLLKILTPDTKDTPLGERELRPVSEINAEIERLLRRFKDMGLFPTERQHKVTGARINLDDYEYVKRDSANADLVGGAE